MKNKEIEARDARLTKLEENMDRLLTFLESRVSDTPKGSAKKENPKKEKKNNQKKEAVVQKTFEENMAEWKVKHSAYKPSYKFKSWLKDHPLATLKEAKAQGFIGTKRDLSDLKVELGVKKYLNA